MRALETSLEFDWQPATTEEGKPFGCLVVQPTLVSRILEAHQNDGGLRKWFDKVSAKDPIEWNIGLDGSLRCWNCFIMPDVDNIRKDILDEDH